MSKNVFQKTKQRHQRSALATRLLESLKHQEMLQPGTRVGVAVSGGTDSVALLLLLLELREKLGIVLSVVHFNHKLRGRTSDVDENFVAKLAEKFALPFHTASANVAVKARKEKANIEDAARQARYEFFAKLQAAGEVTQVAVAHTADDQAETVLAHILRGTGLTGLGGIHPIAGHIVRPLLKFRRSDLRSYLKTRKQSWREDVTNRDTSRLRARIRKKLLPLLEKQFQSAVVQHLASLADLAREDETLLERVVEEKFLRNVEKNDGGAQIEIASLLAKSKREAIYPDSGEHGESARQKSSTEALAKRLIRRIVSEVKRKNGELGSHHVEAVLHLAKSGENGKSLTLPGGIEVRREHKLLRFVSSTRTAKDESAKNRNSFEYEYNIVIAESGARIDIAELRCAIRLRVIDWPHKREETNDIRAVLDRDRLHFPLMLRNWRPGDRLQPVGHKNSHKLKRLLNEKRVSRWERTGWPVLTSGGVIAWARGFPVAVEFAAHERTRAGIVIVEEHL
jgi:tRNA(Ile)-lysidine synthase